MTSQRTILSDPLHFLARGLGSGLSPVAPGTMGSIVGLGLFLLLPSDIWIQLAIIVSALFVGIWICDVVGRDLGVPDHESIVWDEIVGMWIALWSLPLNIWVMALGFLLFRLFDILKPWPIRWVDNHLKNGFGVMLDDVLAGVMANVCLWVGLLLIRHFS